MVHRVLLTVTSLAPIVNDASFSLVTPVTLGQLVGTVTASNNPTTWIITAGNAAGNFAIDNLGQVTITANGVANLATGSAILTVQASNPGGNDTGSVTINYAPASSSQWKLLKIGAGGFLTGLDISKDGTTRVTRTDTYGAWLSVNNGDWQQLLSVNRMPPADSGFGQRSAMYEAVVAPNDPTRIYMYTAEFGRIFVSHDRGASFVRTGFTAAPVTIDGARMYGRFMAVDPQNPDVVYAGSPTQLFKSSNGGVSFSQMAGVPNASAHTACAGVLVNIDPSSAVVGGQKQRILASSAGNGIYESLNGGTSWARCNTAGMPTTHQQMDIGPTGILWIVPEDSTVKKYIGSGTAGTGTWTTYSSLPNSGGGMQIVAAHPTDPNTIVACQSINGGLPIISTNGGTTWMASSDPNARIATDIPWLAWTEESHMTPGHIKYNPVTLNLEFSQGIGYWRGPPITANGQQMVWTSNSVGIEQLVGTQILSPWVAGSKLISMWWDRPEFTSANPDVYPTTHGSVNPRNTSIVQGFCADWASNSPNVIVAVGLGLNDGADYTGRSTDGGTTWAGFGTYPPGQGGIIAAASSSNYVMLRTYGASNAYYTTNSGGLWQAASGLPGDGLSSSPYLNRHNLCADRVTANTFYMYTSGTNPGVYKSSNSGQTWSRVFSGNFAIAGGDNFNFQLRSVPNNAGHLFATAGQQSSGGGPDNTGTQLKYCINAGVNWTDVPNMLAVRVGFGLAAPGKTYPALYVVGLLSGIYGIYQCINAGDNIANPALWTWTKIGDYPLGSFDLVVWIEGDANIYNRVYVTTGGSGGAYYG